LALSESPDLPPSFTEGMSLADVEAMFATVETATPAS